MAACGTAHPVQTVSDNVQTMHGLANAYLSELCASSCVETYFTVNLFPVSFANYAVFWTWRAESGWCVRLS